MTHDFSQNLDSTGALPGRVERAPKRDRLFVAERPSYAYSRHAELQLSALTRALGPQDLEYLERQGEDARRLVRYARASRKRFVELYLQERSRAFFAGARIAREFAADSDAPELAFAVFRQTIRFRAVSAALRLSLTFNLVGPAFRLLDSLAQTGRTELPAGVTQTTSA